jgi:uncharacterized membrane protein YeaQ/YmgE (transglycosylase-associated protein family)
MPAPHARKLTIFENMCRSPASARAGAAFAAALRMTITLTGLLILLVVAGVCGSIGRAIAGGPRGGVIVSIAVGFIGALLGAAIASHFRLPELLVVAVDRRPFPILWSIIGASLFVALIHLLSGAPLRRRYY